jgi:putative signal transducing protein
MKQLEVYRARSGLEAQVLRLALENEGVRVEIQGELLEFGGELPGWSTSPRLFAAEEDAPQVRLFLENWERTRRTA